MATYEQITHTLRMVKRLFLVTLRSRFNGAPSTLIRKSIYSTIILEITILLAVYGCRGTGLKM